MQAKPLSKEATEIFEEIFSHLDEDNNLKLDNAPGVFMAVHGEHYLTTGAYKCYLAHFYEQNGDLMHDPSISFVQVCRTNEVYAVDFTQSSTGTFQEPCIYQNGQVIVIPGKEKEAEDIAAFAEIWLKNIKEQQGL